jgi:hypothetical protein
VGESVGPYEGGMVGEPVGLSVGISVGDAVVVTLDVGAEVDMFPGWHVKHNVLLFSQFSNALLKRASAMDTSAVHIGAQSKPG